jgi:hypothetical protein
MHAEAALPTFRIEPGIAIAQTRPPLAKAVTRASSALEVMTDLARVKAATVAPATSLCVAEQTMINQGVRMLFVVTGLPSIEGLITSTDLHGDQQMRLVHERGLRWADLCVADVMTPVSALDAVDFDDLRLATVGNLIATLKRHGRNHLLVRQTATELSPHRVRGVISRAQIERQLGESIVLSEIASSFAEIERALA